MTIPLEEVKEEALKDPEVKAHYVLLEEKYALIEALIRARASAGLTQEEIASRMRTNYALWLWVKQNLNAPFLKDGDVDVVCFIIEGITSQVNSVPFSNA